MVFDDRVVRREGLSAFVFLQGGVEVAGSFQVERVAAMSPGMSIRTPGAPLSRGKGVLQRAPDLPITPFDSGASGQGFRTVRVNFHHVLSKGVSRGANRGRSLPWVFHGPLTDIHAE